MRRLARHRVSVIVVLAVDLMLLMDLILVGWRLEVLFMALAPSFYTPVSVTILDVPV